MSKETNMIQFDTQNKSCLKCNAQFSAVEYYISDRDSQLINQRQDRNKLINTYNVNYGNIAHKNGHICTDCLRKSEKTKFILGVIVIIICLLICGNIMIALITGNNSFGAADRNVVLVISLFSLLLAINRFSMIISWRNKTFCFLFNKMNKEEQSESLSAVFCEIANKNKTEVGKEYLSVSKYRYLLK